MMSPHWDLDGIGEHTHNNSSQRSFATSASRANTTTIDTSLDAPPNIAYYVTTGAVIPKDCDCVVPIEQVIQLDNNKIAVQPDTILRSGRWIRSVGCDIPAGTILLSKQQTIDPIGMGLLLQSGSNGMMIPNPFPTR